MQAKPTSKSALSLLTQLSAHKQYTKDHWLFYSQNERVSDQYWFYYDIRDIEQQKVHFLLLYIELRW